MNRAARNVMVKNPRGIHIKPATWLSYIAANISGVLRVHVYLKRKEEMEIKLWKDSVRDVLRLGMGNGSRVQVIVEGSQRQEVLDRILDLMNKLLQDEDVLEGGNAGFYLDEIEKIKADETLRQHEEARRNVVDDLLAVMPHEDRLVDKRFPKFNGLYMELYDLQFSETLE